MKIQIRKPIGYSQIGRKDQQEDAVWPSFSDVSADNPCIILCDGVGGSEHGEVASQTSSKVIGEYLTNIIKDSETVTDADVQKAVNLAYDELEKIDTEGSESGKVSMATTLTCVCLHNDGILAAHMGDSRIYLVRPGEGLKYQSNDHSLVNALLQAGEITEEEAVNFPRKNVITRAIQPHCERRYKAEVHQLTDIQSGDYIFLCCDGVLEQLTNERLVEILSMNCSDKDKLALLEAESTDKTRDNYTAYLIPIDNVEGESSIVHDDEVATVVLESGKKSEHETAKTVNRPAPKQEREQDKADIKNVQTNKSSKKTFYILSVLVVLLIAFFVGRCSSKGSEKSDKEGTKIETLLEQIKLESEGSPKSVSPQNISLSPDLSFFEVKGNVKNTTWKIVKWDEDSKAMGSPSSTCYEFKKNGTLARFDNYDAFVEEREEIEDLPDFKLGFFRGDDGYICMQSFSGAMSSYDLYQWQNQHVNIVTQICEPTGEEIKIIKKYDDKGLHVSDICTMYEYPDTTNVLERYTVEYTYTKVEKNSNWTERKGYTDGKLRIVETREIDYYK